MPYCVSYPLADLVRYDTNAHKRSFKIEELNTSTLVHDCTSDAMMQCDSDADCG